MLSGSIKSFSVGSEPLVYALRGLVLGLNLWCWHQKFAVVLQRLGVGSKPLVLASKCLVLAPKLWF
jgi:hypothetical protein